MASTHMITVPSMFMSTTLTEASHSRNRGTAETKRGLPVFAWSLRGALEVDWIARILTGSEGKLYLLAVSTEPQPGRKTPRKWTALL